ncbi:NAD(P)-dependent oxidoreductase [Sutcliffiella halmapala]|uniref:NAD(P)-dependent oxidoreductase n=1 Tax=Sutcliffiella halmapala TaxID=79882 RepID=UPI00099505C5|nr:NAD(P)-dependent oxidoreductase [Sutcliffiella halmapala]
MSVKRILGFIGLGNMGLPMAGNLINEEYEVFGFDINPTAIAKFQEKGGHICPSIKEVLQRVDVVFLSLPSPAIVEKAFYEEGIIKYGREGLIIIDTSTVTPELNRKVFQACLENKLKYLGSPISGGVIGAVNATLTFMVGGPKQDFEEVLPLLNILGKNLFHVGENPGSGTVIKLINNLMIGFYTQAVGEALTLGEKMGLDHESMFEILNVSYGQSRIYERNYKEYIAENNFEPGFTTNLLLKDLKIAKQMAEDCKVQLPIGDHLVEWYSQIANEGYGENDMSAAYLMTKKLAEKAETTK